MTWKPILYTPQEESKEACFQNVQAIESSDLDCLRVGASQGGRRRVWVSPSKCWSPEHGHILGREKEFQSVWDLCPGLLHSPEA